MVNRLVLFRSSVWFVNLIYDRRVSIRFFEKPLATSLDLLVFFMLSSNVGFEEFVGRSLAASSFTNLFLKPGRRLEENE